ncbi:MAG: hypothetical protein JSS81_11815 [Acidobacteria bacterium]|nr:hypothetical protein [Acidobacteriota bacterium]
MLKRIGMMLLMAGLFGLLAVAANAQTKTPRGGKRMDLQKARIKRGVKNGSLTRRETKRLRNERKRIKSDAKVAKSDGVVTRGERRSLRRELNKSSKDIYRAKHNRKTRR